jgi:hypothetical protein
MDDTTRALPVGDAEIDAMFAEIDALMENWGTLIEEQLTKAQHMRDLVSILEEQFSFPLESDLQ